MSLKVYPPVRPDRYVGLTQITACSLQHPGLCCSCHVVFYVRDLLCCNSFTRNLGHLFFNCIILRDRSVSWFCTISLFFFFSFACVVLRCPLSSHQIFGNTQCHYVAKFISYHVSVFRGSFSALYFCVIHHIVVFIWCVTDVAPAQYFTLL